MTPRDTALGLVVALLWGVNFVVMKHATTEFPPLLLTALRFALAAIPLVFLLPRPAIGWRPLLAFGVAFGMVKFTLLFLAFRLGMPAGLGALVLQSQVLLTVLAAAALLGERPHVLQWFGLALAMAGIGLVGLEGHGVALPDGRTLLLPIFLTLAAAAAWAIANVVVKVAAPRDALGFAVWASLGPPLPLFVLSLAVDGPDTVAASLREATALGWTAVLYLAYPISVLSIALWAHLLSRYDSATVAPFALLVPVIGAAAGAAAYGERAGLFSLLGAFLVLAGLALNVSAQRRSMPHPIQG